MKAYFKHSRRCPVSLAAKREVDSFLKKFGERINFTLIDVLEQKNLSAEISERFGIIHESPQIIIFDEEDHVIWDGSHRNITEETLIKAAGL